MNNVVSGLWSLNLNSCTATQYFGATCCPFYFGSLGYFGGPHDDSSSGSGFG